MDVDFLFLKDIIRESDGYGVLKMKGMVVFDTSYRNTRTISETLEESGIEGEIERTKEYARELAVKLKKGVPKKE